MSKAVEIHNLLKTYKNGTQALKGVDLNIAEGDFFALLGANGAGKTTIIGILTGLVNKTSGDVSIFGLNQETHLDEIKKNIGVVPQEFNFSIFEKVIDIIVFQAGYFGMTKKQALIRAEELLKALELWEKRDVISRTLSGGMKRRLMIARSLMHNPKLLILDEPTAGVDVELRFGMWNYLKKLNQNGTTILLTTHYLEEVEQMCKNVAIIKDGQIIKNNSVKNMLMSIETETYSVTIDKDLTHYLLKELTANKIDNNTFEIDLGKEFTVMDLTKYLEKNNYTILDIRPTGNRLEKLFLKSLKN